MRMRYLRYFTVLAEEQHFHRAANRLHIEQSPLSRAISMVEHELGVKLFDRSQRGSTLTQSGQALLTEAQRVLLAYDELKRTASALVHEYQHTVRVGLAGMAIGLAHPDLARWLGRAREDLVDIDLQVLECDDGALVRALRDGTLDVGVTLGAVAYDDLVVHPIWQDPIQVVVPAGHALARYVDVTLADVHAYPLIVCHPQSDAAASAGLHALLDSHPDQPVIGQYASSIPSMLTLVAAGFGVSFIAQSQARSVARDDVRFLRLVEPLAVFPTYVLYRPGALREADQRFLALAEALPA